MIFSLEKLNFSQIKIPEELYMHQSSRSIEVSPKRAYTVALALNVMFYTASNWRDGGDRSA